MKPGIIDKQEKLSVTQYEIFKAIESDIPVYCFVDENVWHDHRVYEENKENADVIKNMKFPSIDKNETAPFIFEFINFMRARTHNNAIYPFAKLEDIEGCLLKQWSNLFQSLLSDSKNKNTTSKQMSQIADQLSDMKALIMSSADKTADSKEIAKGVIKYRLMVTYVDELLPSPDLILKEQNWDDLMKACHIVEVRPFEDEHMRNRMAIIKTDQTFFLHYFYFNDSKFEENKKLWSDFVIIKKEIKQIIVEAIRDSSNAYMKELKYYNKKFDMYLQEIRSINKEIPEG